MRQLSTRQRFILRALVLVIVLVVLAMFGLIGRNPIILHSESKAMTELINGQIVPALGQWQGTVLIITTLVVSYLLRCFWRLSTSN